MARNNTTRGAAWWIVNLTLTFLTGGLWLIVIAIKEAKN